MRQQRQMSPDTRVRRLELVCSPTAVLPGSQGDVHPTRSTGAVDHIYLEDPDGTAVGMRHSSDHQFSVVAPRNMCLFDIDAAFDALGQRLQRAPKVGLGPPVEIHRQVRRQCQRDEDYGAHCQASGDIRIHGCPLRNSARYTSAEGGRSVEIYQTPPVGKPPPLAWLCGTVVSFTIPRHYTVVH